MTVLLSPVWPMQQFFDNRGKPLAGGQVKTCVAGSFTTLANTYSTSAGDVPNANPITLDASGRLGTALWLTENLAYNLILLDSIGNVLTSIDNVYGTYIIPSVGTAGTYRSVTTDAQGRVIAGTNSDAYVIDAPFHANPSGDTNTKDAVQAAFNAGVTRFPAGTFVINGDLTVPAAAWNNIQGAGKGRTILKFTNGGLRCPITGFKNYHAFTIAGLSILTTQADEGTTGLRIYNANAPNGGEYTVRISDVEIGGWSGVHGAATGPVDWWDICLQLDGVRFVHWDDLLIYGGNPGRTSVGIDILAPNRDSPANGFQFSGTNFAVSSCTKGMRVNGWVEGIYANNFELWACRDAFTGNHVDSAGLISGTWFFSNGHMNGSRDCFTSNGYNNIGFVNMSLNRGVQETPGHPGYPGDILRIENAGPDGEICISDSRLFNAFANQGAFVALQNTERVIIDGLSCYGGTSTNLFALGGTTDNVLIDNVFCDTPVINVLQLGGNTGGGNIQYGNLIVPHYTTFRADTGDKLGKYISSFSAYLTAVASNVSGDGSFYSPAGWTKLYDNGGLLNAATGLITIKVAGWYSFEFVADFIGLLVGHTAVNIYLVTASGNAREHGNLFPIATSGSVSLSVRAEFFMNAGDAVTPTLMVLGGTKVVGLNNAITGTRVSGHFMKQG